ncbi:hypothetical protein NDU88_005442 [Pleurodeles waltl]|uniref:Uncharacterized protein n=1 Tax=Pleurodeles waltl TaxID=8319 RepID=A0AAV7NRI7_PLEWA|nr:hypothetical protein NDU88_005442 [Pleurodeles waltl]
MELGKKSRFNPLPSTNPPEAPAFEEDVFKEVEELNPGGNVFQNHTRGEREALDYLSKKNYLVIKLGDKVAATVIQGKEEYREACLTLLRDGRNYEVLFTDRTNCLQNIIKTLLDEAMENKWITSEQREFFTISEPQMLKFYTI